MVSPSDFIRKNLQEQVWPVVTFILLVSLVTPKLIANDKYGCFKHITSEDGLSHENVSCIYKDKAGYLWFGTHNGLNRYDGYKTIVYNSDSKNNQSISNDLITSITEDFNGSLWIGTNKGLNRYNRHNDTFERYFSDPDKPNSLSNNKITYLYLDNQQNLWIGTENGLNKYDTLTNSFIQFHLEPNSKESLKNNNIDCILDDGQGNLWIGSWLGWLSKFNKSTGKYKSYQFINKLLVNSENSTISGLYQTDKNTIIVLVNNNLMGIAFDIQREIFVPWHHPDSKYLPDKTLWKTLDNLGNLWSFDGNKIHYYNSKSKKSGNLFFHDSEAINDFREPPFNIFDDGQGNYWYINRLYQCYKYETARSEFSSFYNPLQLGSEKSQDYVRDFVLDKDENLWIGTFGNGLLMLSKDRKNYLRFLQSGSENGIVNNFITSLAYDSINHKIWTGTLGGISIIDIKSKKLIANIRSNSSDKLSLYDNYIKRVFRDSRNNYWIATSESLDLIDTKNNNITHYSIKNSNGISHYNVTSIFEDNEGIIWVGTFEGLNRFNYNTKKFENNFSGKMGEKLVDAFINLNGLFQTSDGLIWIATRDGLYFYNKDTREFNTLSTNYNEPGNFIHGMMEDKSGNLWCIGEMLLYRINYKSGLNIRTYDNTSDLSINIEGYYQSPDGKFYIGGRKNGYYEFYPDSIIVNKFIPPVKITDFLLMNQSVKISTKDSITPLKENLETIEKIELKHSQSFITFEFSALNYTLSEKNKFAYKLVGFNDEWVYTDAKRRYATYTNLNPGKYTFIVKASNNDDIWNEEGKSINLVVLPPIWKSKIAYLLYILVLAALIYITRDFSLKRVHEKNIIKLEKVKTEKEIEFNQMKIKFFTYISHELRTPLTLISGPLNKLISVSKENKFPDNTDEYLYFMHRNVNRLKDLTNQLLDMRKIDSGTMKLELCNGDICDFIKTITNNFLSVAGSKNINLTFISETDISNVFFDPDKIDKILTNLISNAIKYTQDGGYVVVKLNKIAKEYEGKESEFLQINVIDSGIGIAKDNLVHIFHQFYQTGSANVRKTDGAGIGLALTRELVTIHQGEIFVESEPGKGSTFIVYIPLKLSDLNDMRIMDGVLEPDNYISESKYVNSDSQEQNIKINSLECKAKDYKILIVEDDYDLRNFMRNILCSDYEVFEAEDGEKGIDTAKNVLPDLIISDVMMPLMNGMDMVNILKNDLLTSHIPIILLTALGSEDKKHTGYQKGADDYITKPFNHELLLIRINNVLCSRKKLQDHYLNLIKEQKLVFSFEPNNVEVVGVDERFLAKVVRVVEEKLPDPEFNVEILASEMGMVSRVLYRKFKALINKNPGDYIFEMRMKRALQILLQQKVPIVEISELVGFNDRKYFSICFKKFYGLSPTKYLKQSAIPEKEV